MSFSLNASLTTCRFDSGDANKIQSDRFLNPALMMCPTWTGQNLKGQEVCPDSFYTKSRGCNSAVDRVVVENDQRPDYISYIGLNAAGINGNIYDNVYEHGQTVCRQQMLDQRDNITGNFGLQFGASRRCTLGEGGKGNKGCSINENAMAQEAQSMRGQGAMQNNYEGYHNMNYAGMNY